MIIETDGFIIDFTDAIDAFVFDEKDSKKATFHGAPMKGVDIMVELVDAYLFVELKDYDDASAYDIALAVSDEDKKEKGRAFKWLKNYLKYKYRDTYLYRHAELKVEKPIHYICLVTFDNALNSRMKKELRKELPVGKSSQRWQLELANSCQVVNFETWNRNWSTKWPVARSPLVLPVAAPLGV
jgi:hypothetical protein